MQKKSGKLFVKVKGQNELKGQLALYHNLKFAHQISMSSYSLYLEPTQFPSKHDNPNCHPVTASRSKFRICSPDASFCNPATYTFINEEVNISCSSKHTHTGMQKLWRTTDTCILNIPFQRRERSMVTSHRCDGILLS